MPGGGFQPLVVKTFKACGTFLSLETGCKALIGKSLLPGKI